MYGEVVLELDGFLFEEAADEIKEDHGIDYDRDLIDAFAEMAVRFKQIVEDQSGACFVEDPYEQLWAAIGEVIGRGTTSGQ